MKRQFTAQLNGDKAEIIIFDEIGSSMFGEGVTASSVQDQLESFGAVREITVRINSPGGELFQGLAIYNLLRANPARIIVEIDGLAGSAASVIAMAGDDIRIAENGMLMIHAPQGVSRGTAGDMRKSAKTLDALTTNLVDIYADRSGQERSVIKRLVGEDERFLNASEAKELGLVTEITGNKEIAAMATSWLREKDNPAPIERKQQNTTTGTQMNIVNALGFTDEAECLREFEKIKMFQNGVVSALEATSAADAVARLSSLTAKAAEVDALRANLTAAKVAAEESTITAQIKQLDADKKLAPAMQGWFRNLDAKARQDFVDHAPALVSTSVATPKALDASNITLTAEDEKILALANITGADRDRFIAQRATELKAVH